MSPVGLEYVGEALTDAGIPVQVLDFSFVADWRGALQKQLRNSEPSAIGLSVRNTDDCSFVSRKSYLPWIADVVSALRELTGAPVLLGGVGFSTMPETVLRATLADFGVEGDGEEALTAVLRCLANGDDVTQLPNMVHRRNGEIIRNPRRDVDLRYLPRPRRRMFDNRRYEQFGAMVGLETKRGCAQGCICCADPLAKGKRIRLRPPEVVVQELRDLVEQGVGWFHLCDSEFNLPMEHGKDVCRAMIDARLADAVSWYCYCSPIPFDRELARLMLRAGCAGINFGVDSLCDEQLRRLGRQHSSGDLHQLVGLLHEEGLNYMFDLLIGGPGETEQTLKETIDAAIGWDVPLVGVAAGVRVYPSTPLAVAVSGGSAGEGLHPAIKQAPHEPVFYLSPLLGDDVFGLLRELVKGDHRFLTLSGPGDKESYNYADDEVLCGLIEKGGRGAYWDIIRQSRRG